MRASIEKTFGLIIAIMIMVLLFFAIFPLFQAAINTGSTDMACSSEYLSLKFRVAELFIYFMSAPKLGDGTLDIQPGAGWFAPAKSICITKGKCKSLIRDLNQLQYATVPPTRCAGGACESLYYCMYKGKDVLDANNDGEITDDEVENGDLSDAEDTNALAAACIQVANYIRTREEYLRVHYSASEYGGTTSNVFTRSPP